MSGLMTQAQFEKASGVSRETSELFDIWKELLLEWSGHTNLVGRSTLEDFWERHALDSWQVFDHLPAEAARIVDIGAGAGMPGLALAFGLMDRGREGQVTLVDSVGKKVRFLRQVIETTGAPAQAFAMRAEELDPDQDFDVVTARAVTALHKLLELTEPLLKNGAVGLFLKGRRYREELTEARKNWRFEVEVIPSRTSDGVILKLSEVQRVRR